MESGLLAEYELYKIDVTRITKEALADTNLDAKSKDRAKNMFVLGFIYWMYNRKLDITIDFLNQKFKTTPDILQANIKVLKAGYHYGDTVEAFSARFQVDSADMSRGEYRNITGNEAVALGDDLRCQKVEYRSILRRIPNHTSPQIYSTTFLSTKILMSKSFKLRMK